MNLRQAISAVCLPLQDGPGRVWASRHSQPSLRRDSQAFKGLLNTNKEATTSPLLNPVPTTEVIHG